MIFTSRFGALAARPNFRDPNFKPELELQREIDELLQTADHEVSADERAS
ncbi:MAG TPA: hypothetical protein VNT92_05630 [Acidimicrobiia bacterium]|nr:hypothetical protein [Acidimicrobiia bacterium]